MFFIIDKVAEKLDIEVSEEEINGHIAQLAIQQGQRPEKVKEEMTRTGSLSTFSLQIREEKCIEKLLESAKITEIAPGKNGKKARKVANKEKTATKAAKKTLKKTAKKAEAKEKKQAKKSKKTTKKKTAK